jgi:hypothetical protein
MVFEVVGEADWPWQLIRSGRGWTGGYFGGGDNNYSAIQEPAFQYCDCEALGDSSIGRMAWR